MQRKWFKMIEGVLIKAPQQIETEAGTLYNYNCDSNEEMLRADGLLMLLAKLQVLTGKNLCNCARLN